MRTIEPGFILCSTIFHAGYMMYQNYDFQVYQEKIKSTAIG